MNLIKFHNKFERFNEIAKEEETTRKKCNLFKNYAKKENKIG